MRLVMISPSALLRHERKIGLSL